MVGTFSLLSAATHEQVSDARVADDRRRETGLPKQAKPYRAREQTVGLAFVHDPYDTLFVAEQESEVNQDGRVPRVRIRGPLHVTHRAVLSVVAAVVCAGDKGFAQLIRHEQGNASRPAVNICGLHDREQIRFGGHMADRIVNKDGVKGPAQPQSSYVP